MILRLILSLILILTSPAWGKPRARELGIPFSGTPGPLNAITDVKGVEVGHTTLINGPSKLGSVRGVMRTGVTVVWPASNRTIVKVPAAWSSMNGNGELTGVDFMDETGVLEGPVVTTNTQSVGIVRDAVVDWYTKHFPVADDAFMPVVGETDDSWLNDLYGFHVRKEHVFHALDNSKPGPVEEGNVGGGTGNATFHFKGGIGTSSRKLESGFTVGVLVQTNFGQRQEMRIAGLPIGKEITDQEIIDNPIIRPYKPVKRNERSIVVVVATDAPLLPTQLKRISKRVSLGMGRLGSMGRNSSGEFFIAFSTVRPKKAANGIETWQSLPIEQMDPLFEATADATEEAIVNAMVAAETLEGVNGNKVFAAPWDRVTAILRRHSLLTKAAVKAE